MECRRLRCDLTEVYIIMRGVAKVNNHNLFPRVEDSKTRKDRFKLRGKRPKGQHFPQRG